MKLFKMGLTMAVLLTLSSSAIAQAATPTTGTDIAKAGMVKTTESDATIKSTTASAQREQLTAEEQKAAAKAEDAEKQRKARIAEDGYSDISDHWAKNAIKAMSQEHYVKGFSDSTFRPNEPITREQIASIYNKLIANHPAQTKTVRIHTYGDVDDNRWSKEAIANVSKAGIMSNYMGDNFSPEHQMTREEFAYTAANFGNYMGLFANDIKPDTKVFKDSNTIASYAKNSVYKLAATGYLRGDTNGNFNPTKLITRAEAISVMYELSHPQGETKDSLKKYANTSTSTAQKSDAKDDIIQKDVTYDAPFDKVTTTDKVDDVHATDTKATTTVDTNTGNKQEKIGETKTKDTKPVASTTMTATPVQTALEDKVFAQLNKLYKTPGEFQNHGVMYWEGSKLHVAVQNAKDLTTLYSRFSQSSDPDLRNKVQLEATRYSQVEFDELDKEFQKLYKLSEPEGTIISTVPDVKNDRLYAIVSTAKSTTVKTVLTKFGTKVKMALQK